MTNFAMIFPGQGSQKLGMLNNLASKYKIVKLTFSEASNVLGYDLWEKIQKGPIERLNQTYITQPAVLTVSIAIWRVWKEQKGKIPLLLAGHSLGEYSALVCSGSLNFKEAVKIVELRGKLMQEAVPIGSGAMSAIVGLNKDIINMICKISGHDKIVELASFNSPNQIVISGDQEAVKRAEIACKKAGAKFCISLPISIPSHCVLMKPAAKKLKYELEKIKLIKPYIPVINNVDVSMEYNPDSIRKALVRQLYYPVRWTEIINKCIEKNIYVFLEVGWGNMLTNLYKNIINNSLIISINNIDSISVAMKL